MDHLNQPVDPYLLIVITGKQSFSMDNEYKKTFDNCNELSQVSMITDSY